MSDIGNVISYLEKITGHAVVLPRVAQKRLSGLPVFLTAAYRFHEWNWLDQTILLALSASDAEAVPSADLKAHHGVLAGHLACPVVFVLPALDVYGRNRLIHLGVPFIVPGLQLFIPPLASLCEQFQRMVKAKRLSAAAQVTVLYQLFRHPPAAAMLNQWAEWLGYSAMTMTKVRDELAANGLCIREEGAKPRGLRFVHQGRAAWDAALPFLGSPVRRTCWAQSVKPPLRLLSGLTALARRTLIEDDSIPTYACRDLEWKRLVEAGAVSVLKHPDGAAARVECWRYAPELLAEDGMVDRLSLSLSLSDSSDERVRLAAQSLLEGVPW